MICIVLSIIVTMMLLKLTSMGVVRATPGLIQPFKDSGVGDAALNLSGQGIHELSSQTTSGQESRDNTILGWPLKPFEKY